MPSKTNPNFYRFPKPIEGSIIAFLMVLFYFTLYDPSHIFLDYLGPLGTFSRYMNRNHYGLLQLILFAAVLAHFGEAVYAGFFCRKKGISAPMTVVWVVQTFIMGFPSLMQLLTYKPEIKRN